MNPAPGIDELRVLAEHLPELIATSKVHLPVEFPAGRGKRVGRASLGLLLRRLAQLEQQADPDLRDQVTEARAAVDAVRARSPERWFDKVAVELNVLADAWQYFVRGVEAKDPRCFEGYAVEVRPRLDAARLAERAGESTRLQAALARLETLDQALRPRFQPDPAPVADDGFPTDPGRHWWLYGAPQLPAPGED